MKNKYAKLILLVLGILGVVSFSGCGSQKQKLGYTEKLIMETKNTPEFFSKVIDIVPSSDGGLVFKYYSSTKGAENTVLVKYLDGGYEFDSNNFDFIDELIPLKGKEVVYRGGTNEKQWVFKKHVQLYGGTVNKVKVNSSENIYFLATEGNKRILYKEVDNKPQKVAEHMMIDDFTFDLEGNVAYVFKDRVDGDWQFKYKDYISEPYNIIYHQIVDIGNTPIFLAKDNDDVLNVVKGGKAFKIEGNYGEFGNLIAYKNGYAFSAFNKDNSQWQVITEKKTYSFGGTVRGLKSNKTGDIVASYVAADGKAKLKFLKEDKDYDSGSQLNDFYLDDSGNLVYIMKGTSGEWQLIVNKAVMKTFVRLDKLFWDAEKVYTAGEDANGAIIFIEMPYSSTK